MSDNIVNLFGHKVETDLPTALEQLAADIRSGEVDAQRVVLVVEDHMSSITGLNYGPPVSPLHILGLLQVLQVKVMASCGHLDGQGIDAR